MPAAGPGSQNDLSRTGALFALCVLGATHTAVALLAFDPFASFLSAASIDTFDYCALDYQCHIARETFAASGRLWGYDPYFLAGHVQTFVWNSNVFLQVLAVALWFLPIGMVLKLVTVFAAAAVPLLVYVGWRGLGFDRRVSLVGALVGVLWFRLTIAHAYWVIGMTTGFLVLSLSLACLGLMAALWRDQKRAWWLLLLLPLTLLVHKTAVVTFVLPATVLVLFRLPLLRARHVGLLAAAGALTLVVNAFWIVPMLRYLGLAVFDPALSYWTNLDPLALFHDLTSPTAKIGIFNRQWWWGDLVFRNLVFWGALLAAWHFRRTSRRWRGPGAAIVAVGVFAYGASFIPALRPLDPSRYVPFFLLLLTIPATLALCARLKPMWAGVVLCILGVGLGALPSSGRHFIEQPVDARPSRELETMAAWIDSLPGDGRVHVETFSSFHTEKPPWNEQFGRVSIKLPTRTKRLLLGGHYSGVFTKYNAANFFSGRWKGRVLGEWSAKELAEDLRRYHVEYLLTWSTPAQEALAEAPSVVEAISAPEGFAGWRVKDPGSFFLTGGGALESWGYDYLEFIDVTATTGPAVSAFHWAPTLMCNGAEPVAVDMPGDPVPFLGLANPSGHVICRNAGAW